VATYYISPSGSNANNGLGPDASHASNKPWLTLGKALNTGSTVVPGDTVYVAPGTYFSEALVPIAGVTSTASPTAVRGDPLNAQGFKDGSAVLLAPGVCHVTARASGALDTTDAPGGLLLNYVTNDPDGLQLYNLVLEGGNGCITVSLNGSNDLLWEDCRILAHTESSNLATITSNDATAPTAGRNFTWRRCIIVGVQTLAADFTSATSAATADADLNIVFEHCLIFGKCNLRAGGANKAGGMRLKGCTMIGTTSGFLHSSTTGRHSTVTKSTMEGCTMIAGARMADGVDADCLQDLGYNRGIGIQFANTNCTEAGTSARNVAGQLVWPDLLKWGLALNLNDILSWIPSAPSAVLGSGWSNTGLDFRGRTARPWGAGPTIGYLEGGHLSQETGSQISGGGANSVKITGAGEVAFHIPVAAAATVVTVTTESTSYGGSNFPQLIVMANPSLGVTQQTASATSAAEQTLAASFTPTAAGVVELRLLSRSTSVSSSTYFDRLGRT
jgi:hypothetical protein